MKPAQDIIAPAIQPRPEHAGANPAPPKRARRGPRLAEGLRDRLEEAIVTGELAAGERLEEVPLAERFGVSRTPVREALIGLAGAGLVTLQPRRGAVVAGVTLARVVEMFEVMAEIEAACARLAAERADAGSKVGLQELHQACAQAAETGDADAYYYANGAFHRAIYSTSGNGFLAEQAEALHARLKPYRRLQLHRPTRVQASLAEHGAITAAIVRGDPAQAGEAARAHVVIQGDRLAEFVADYRGRARTAA